MDFLGIKIVDHSGTDGLFWYFEFKGNFYHSTSISLSDEIIKNDFDSCVCSLLTKVRPFFVILHYDCFAHVLLMPKVHFFSFSPKIKNWLCISTEKL
jgi:hypothetical protein